MEFTAPPNIPEDAIGCRVSYRTEEIPIRKPTTCSTNSSGIGHLIRDSSLKPPIASSFDRSKITMTTAELATSYAALILADDGIDITVRDVPLHVVG